ncbi:MAG TPA: hypothetical protein VIT44_05245 [Cyclobacteriaceae bacterium]
MGIPQPFASLMLHADPKDIIITSKTFDEPLVNDRATARLLGKIGIESLAQEIISQKTHLDLNFLVDDDTLNALRDFVRYNSDGKWDYYVRRLYNENEIFYYKEDLQRPVDVPYQYGNFMINNELLIVIILKGYEFVLNMNSRSIQSYIRWLLMNDGKSLLFTGKIL